MQQYLTLEEAANYLQTSTDDMREMAKKKLVRAFQDKGSWRFRAQDIHELARVRGIQSEAEMEIGEILKLNKGNKSAPEDLIPINPEVNTNKSSDLPISEESSPVNNPSKPVKPGSDSDVRLVLDSNLDFRLEDDLKNPSFDKKGVEKSKDGGDDIKLEKESPKSPSDSDIRLQDDSPVLVRGNESGVITEEIDLDAEQSRHLEDLKNRGDKLGNKPSDSFKHKGHSEKKSGIDSSSDFELIPFDSANSSGEREITLSSSLSDLQEPIAKNNKDLSNPNQNRLNHQANPDSDHSREGPLKKSENSKGNNAKRDPKSDTDDSSSEFELTLDDVSGEGSSSEFELSMDEPLGVPDSSSEFELSLDGSDSSVVDDDAPSDSEFELTLDDEGSLALEKDGGDIFEETTFDVPALEGDSESEAVALDESGTDLEESDFDISIDEESTSTEKSESQVVALEDEEEADDAAKTIAKPRKIGKQSNLISSDGDDDSPTPKGKKKPKKIDTNEDDLEDELEDEFQQESIQESKDWGSLPAVILFPTVVVLFLVGIMSFELLRGMFGYHRSTVVGKPLVDNLARLMDDSLPK